MIRSLYAGVSGMKNHQIRMDVTGNNIANVNTTGFKGGRVNFQDTLYQTINSGGDSRNPAQVGAGMSVGSISNNFTQGPLQSTGRALDLAIDGNGFFVVSDGVNNYFTREGTLFIDNQGFLVNGDGLKVQSYDTQTSTFKNIQVFNGPVSTLSVGPDGAIKGQNNEGVELFFSNPPAALPPAVSPEEGEPLTGGEIEVSNLTIDDYQNKGFEVVVNGVSKIINTGTFSTPPSSPPTAAEIATLLEDSINNEFGDTVVQVASDGNTLKITNNLVDVPKIGVTPSIKINGEGAEVFGLNGAVAYGVAGYQPSRDQSPSNQITLASFSNPEGLVKAGKNLFVANSETSGNPILGEANSPGFGTINSGYLEGSNVDLTEEFTNMITTQRGYQANARVITTSDSMLEELINLKR